jgi:hypothetical protein
MVKINKNKCPKTMSGKHLWFDDEVLMDNGYFKKCEACGMIDDKRSGRK